jgi:hypothetical protein
MKFVTPSQFADPDTAARKLAEIANATEAVQDGRIYIELVNGAFLEAGGTPDQYRAALARAIALGCPLSPAALTNAGTSTMATCTSARSLV